MISVPGLDNYTAAVSAASKVRTRFFIFKLFSFLIFVLFVCHTHTHTYIICYIILMHVIRFRAFCKKTQARFFFFQCWALRLVSCQLDSQAPAVHCVFFCSCSSSIYQVYVMYSGRKLYLLLRIHNNTALDTEVWQQNVLQHRSSSTGHPPCAVRTSIWYFFFLSYFNWPPTCTIMHRRLKKPPLEMYL